MKKLIVVSLLCSAFLTSCGGGSGGEGGAVPAKTIGKTDEICTDQFQMDYKATLASISASSARQTKKQCDTFRSRNAQTVMCSMTVPKDGHETQVQAQASEIYNACEGIDRQIENEKFSDRDFIDYKIGFTNCLRIQSAKNVKDMREGGISSYNQRLIKTLDRLYPTKTGFYIINDCLGSYTSIFEDSKFPNLYAESYGNRQNEAALLYEKTYSLLWNAFEAIGQVDLQNPSFWNLFSLMDAPTGFIEVSKRQKQLEDFKGGTLVSLAASQRLLSVEGLKIYVESLLENYSFWLLLQKNSRGQDILLNPVDILRNPQKYAIGDAKKTSLENLESALIIVNTAIAQNSLLAGDYLMDLITKVFTSSNKTLAELRPDVVELFKQNPILFQNWSQYLVISQILADPQHGARYATGIEKLDGGDVISVLKPLPLGIDVSPIDEGGKRYLALTMPEASAKAKLLSLQELNLFPPKRADNLLVYPSEMKILVDLKQRLLSVITSYNAGTYGFTPQDVAAAKQIAFESR